MSWFAGIHPVTLVTFLPLLGAIAVALVPASRPDAVRRVALLFALGAWVVSLGLLAAYVTNTAGFQFRTSTTGSPCSASSTTSASTACRSS
jgi:NADH:ubiquinone oxidoreductase subunit 4 (subunit M)